MSLTAEELQARRGLIGSSDSPPIVGVDPWRNAADVWLEKTQEVEQDRPKEATEIGNDFEAPLLRWAARELGVEIRENVRAIAVADPLFGAQHDALVVGKQEGLEAKTGTGSDYGTPETDEVPERVIIQCQHQCMVSELELVWVPVLIAKFDRLERVMYRVKRNEPLIQLIVERDHAFWEDHVLPRIPPVGFVPSLSVLRRIRRIPQKLASVDPALVEAWRLAQAVHKEAERQKEEAAAALLAAAGDAEGIDFGDPRKILTFRGYSYEALDGKRLKAIEPATWEKFKKVIVVAPSLREVRR